MPRRSCIPFVALAASALLSGPSHAEIIIPASRAIGPVPAQPGEGLTGYAYAFPDPFNNLRTLADADAFIAGNAPAATFLASQIDYPRPGGGGAALAELLGPDAASLDPASFGSTSPSLVYRFLGAIAITAGLDLDPTSPTIEVEFAMGSDDASRLRIGGLDVLRVAGPDPTDERGVYDANDFRTIASFGGPGLYPVEIVWWDWYGGVSIHWFGSIPGAPQPNTPPGLAGIVPTSVLYAAPAAVPEPGTIVACLVGLPFLFTFGRRARRGHRQTSHAAVAPTSRPSGYRRLLWATAAVAVLGPAPARADVVLSDNLDQPPNIIGEIVEGSRWVTASFGTDSRSYEIADVTLPLTVGTVFGQAEVAIYTDDGFRPGALLGTLDSPPVVPEPTTGETVFTASGILLAPNSTYWVVMRALTEGFEWNYTGSDIGAGVGFQHTWGRSLDAGLTWETFDSEPMLMRVRANAVADSVPEPTTVALLGIGGLALLTRARPANRRPEVGA